MTKKYVWNDEYDGPRYAYYIALRPILPSMLPKEITVVISVGQDPRTVVTTEPLPECFIKQTDLEATNS